MFVGKEEKKVEFIELIYDLIFVYIIGRNNSILHNITGGVVSLDSFLAYVVSTLAIIQIWNFTTFYINRYGKNRVRDYILLFVNMYLLYYIAEGTRSSWHDYLPQYCIAWGLILINIGIHYIIEYKEHLGAPWETVQIKRNVFILFGEAVLVFACIPMFQYTKISLVGIPILFGIIATIISSNVNKLVVVDFAHLTERAMLYVVLTFGEMIIVIASYFEGKNDINTIYFSVMAFLIVVGMFLSYGKVYNDIIDKNLSTNGTGYMMMHVFLIFALNNITTSLEFMRDEKVDLLFKVEFLAASMVLYYVFLFLTERYAKERLKPCKSMIISVIILTVGFVAVMILFRTYMYVNIAATVIFAFGIYGLIHKFGKAIND